jgi:hypothetical protein
MTVGVSHDQFCSMRRSPNNPRIFVTADAQTVSSWVHPEQSHNALRARPLCVPHGSQQVIAMVGSDRPERRVKCRRLMQAFYAFTQLS